MKICSMRVLCKGLSAIVAVTAFSAYCQGQVASALLREGEILPGETTAILTAINNTAQNGVEGFAFTVTTDGSTSRVWGNATGGAGATLQTEGIIGVLEQTSFESFFGFSDAGESCYSAISNMGATTGLDGAWLDSLLLLNEEEPIAALPGQFSTFNSRPGITFNGHPYWVGGFSDTQGGSTQNRALFYGTSATVLIAGGDSIPGVTEPVEVGSSIDFDSRVSELGTSYITHALLDATATDDGLIVVNGNAQAIGTDLLRENSPVPASAGGLVGELWDNFDFLGINEVGNYMVTGDTNAATANDEFVLVDDQIVLREGDLLGSDTISGAIEGGFLNANGDWSVIWDANDVSGANREVLILNGEIILSEGDLVDWNGDGIIDAMDNNTTIENFTGISSLTIGPRNPSGQVPVMFTADCDVNGATLEGGFLMLVTPPSPVVHVDSFDVTRGDYVSGGLAELRDSDNADLSARRRQSDIQSRVFIEFKGLSPTATPASLEVTLEASVFARSTVNQSIDLFNYQTLAWEEIDTRTASRLTDQVTTVMAAGDLARFVSPDDGCVLARVRFESLAARQNFSANVDQFFWTIE